MLQIPVYYYCRSLFFFDEPMNGERMTTILASMFQQALNLLLSHGTITAIGFVYVKAEILNMGNEQMLDNLEEGLIIKDPNETDKS